MVRAEACSTGARRRGPDSESGPRGAHAHRMYDPDRCGALGSGRQYPLRRERPPRGRGAWDRSVVPGLPGNHVWADRSNPKCWE